MSARVKVTISVKQHLFDDVEALAKELNVSRSKLFVLAAEEFMRKHESTKMLAQINAAFNNSLSEVERKIPGAMKSKQKEILEDDPW